MEAGESRPERGGSNPLAFRDPLFPDWPEEAAKMVAHLHLEEGPVAAAMRGIPRHRFLPRRLWTVGYLDTPLPVGPEATISAPHMVAMQLETAELREGQGVLEAGSGSGYLAALVATLVSPGGSVIGVEIEPSLVGPADQAIHDLGLDHAVHLHHGNGAAGYPPGAPYDRIIVSYAIRPPLPDPWGRQLREGGLILAPVDRGDGTYLERMEKGARGNWKVNRGPACLFVSAKA